MTFTELKLEYTDQLIGEGIYEIVRELASKIARKYPESVYNGGLSWDGQSIDDLCQEVVLNQLITQNQIHYIFDQSNSLESVRRLITAQVKRALVTRRKKSPIDRLLRRISDLGEDIPIEKVEQGTPRFFRLKGSASVYAPLDSQQVNACVRAVSSIPRLESRLDSSRESMIYTAKRLHQLIRLILEVVPAVSDRDLREILEILLTPWVPATLVPVEKEFLLSGSNAEDSMEEEQMIAAAQSLADSLSHEQLVVLVLKSQNLSDSQVAAEVGLSRPTVADMKKTVLGRVRQELILELPTIRHELAMQHLLERSNQRLEGATR